MSGYTTVWPERLWLSCLLSWMLAFGGCTTYVVIPDDRELREVYTQEGERVDGRVSISMGYLADILRELEETDACQPHQ